MPVKLLQYLVRSIVCQRGSIFQVSTTETEVLPLDKNWCHALYKRHPEVKPRTLRPLDWAHHDFYEKVEQWFTVIRRELGEPTIMAEKIYNMDEMGILLSVLVSRKFLTGLDSTRRYRGDGWGTPDGHSD